MTLVGVPATVSQQSATRIVVTTPVTEVTGLGDVVTTSILYGNATYAFGFSYIPGTLPRRQPHDKSAVCVFVCLPAWLDVWLTV